ncbi:phosphoribosylanthranilate isomerase [Thermosynechococcaceae cyanobacterium Okahandja]
MGSIRSINGDPIAVKICGLTQADQAVAIARMGVSALGFICVPNSRRYIPPSAIASICQQLPEGVLTVGVVANPTLAALEDLIHRSQVQAIQLHGDESPAFCEQVQQQYPNLQVIKALRVKSKETLEAIPAYVPHVSRLLLDAYHPQQLGGTGAPFDWRLLQDWQIPCSWWLAGGITPENCRQAVAQTRPHGLDLSSGVEISPGIKDLGRVAALLHALGINADHPLHS